MKVIDLLNKIANGEIGTGTIFYVNGDFFYDLVVINENLYVINTMSKQIELLENKYINRFIRDDVELLILKEENIEDKKIEKLEYIENGDFIEVPSNQELMSKINEIIDYIMEDKDV
jgi:hypothetical protein